MKKNENKTSAFQSRQFKSGAFSTILIIVVSAVIILLNLFMQEVRLSYDVSNQNMYTLTEDTNQLAEQITDEITIYYLVNNGREYAVIERILDQYDAFKNITVVNKDPNLYPAFASQYTDNEVAQNDMIIVNETTGKYRYLEFGDVYIEELDYSTYSTNVTLDAEGQITAAIIYVITDLSSTMYVVNGHGEVELGTEATRLIEKSNIEMESLTTLTTDTIPEDCDVLMINGP